MVHNSLWILTFSCLAGGNRNYFWPHVTTRALLPLFIFIYFRLFFSHFQIIFLHGCQYSTDYLRRTFCRSLSSLFLKLSPPVLVLEKLSYFSFHGFFLQLSESAVLSLDLPSLYFVAWNITRGNNWSNLSFIFFMFPNSLIFFLCCLIYSLTKCFLYFVSFFFSGTMINMIFVY